ncbi:MAG TPA: alcohol dehydrogenase catalytic domain-containing protein [Bacteroidales bacterium]|nr:alcohol dehydrogenase catalytic domain-containing protein [Bacteroidales bacterium]
MVAALQYKPGEALVVEDIPIPEPGPGEVLIKMSHSPINPSDLSMLRGTYAHLPSYPVIPGIEGSGIVVKAGKGILPRMRLNKKVACSSTPGLGGTWAEYMVTSAKRTIPLDRSIDMEQGSMLIVNPMTAVGIMKITDDGRHKAIVNNAAASSLGKMLINLCRRKNIPLINIVRRQKQAKELSDSGSEYVLNSAYDNFPEDLKKLSGDLGATLFLDAIGGDQTRILAEAAPHGSIIMLYAKLSEEDFSLDSRVILQGNKTINGFSLTNWSGKKKIWQVLRDIKLVKSMLNTELKSTINARFQLREINDAIDTYRNGMSKGKVLIILGK